jgi:hypothetical protein
MGVAVRASAPKQIPQGSSPAVHPLFAKSPDILQRILSFANDSRLAHTCRDFLNATNTLLQREWSRFDLKSYPYINSVFLGRPPTNLGELGAIVDEMQGKCHIQTLSPRYAANALKTMKAPFLPVSFKTLEDAARQAESDRNLCLIWKRIAGTLNIPANSLSSEEIKQWLRTHADELARIEILDLSNLNLTIIPEEFSTLLLPNLTRLYLNNTEPSLYKNQFKTLPNNFGANWNRLVYFGLTINQLTVLPDNFGSAWNQLEDLDLFGNQLSVLPNNFGANWNRLRELTLQHNQLSALPNNFGSNWPWWSEATRRIETLHDNPILNPAPIALPIPRQGPPQNQPAAQPTPVTRSLQNLPTRLHTPEVPAEKSLKALLNTAAIHVFSTAVLSVFASYVFSSKIPLALGAVYLGHRYTKGVLWE